VADRCCTEANVDLVYDLVLSQEDTPQTRRTLREITVLSKVDDFATFNKVEVHAKNSTF